MENDGWALEIRVCGIVALRSQQCAGHVDVEPV
jgi:hypothetical protein